MRTRSCSRRESIPPAFIAALFAYAFISNVALAVVPHEPVVIWCGREFGVWVTAVVATAGTVVAGWVDHRLFVPLIGRVQHTPLFAAGTVGWLRARFARRPFLVLVASGVAPLPFFPFKALAFAEAYPIARYLLAVALGRFPRYVLLAWLGILVRIPAWILVAAFAVMLLPSVRVLWKRPSAK